LKVWFITVFYWLPWICMRSRENQSPELSLGILHIMTTTNKSIYCIISSYTLCASSSCASSPCAVSTCTLCSSSPCSSSPCAISSFTPHPVPYYPIPAHPMLSHHVPSILCHLLICQPIQYMAGNCL
jgi:hypothetical protein